MTTAPQWRTSSRSGQGNNCVEIATNFEAIALIRDSKLGDGSPILDVTPTVFTAFVEATKNNQFR